MDFKPNQSRKYRRKSVPSRTNGAASHHQRHYRQASEEVERMSATQSTVNMSIPIKCMIALSILARLVQPLLSGLLVGVSVQSVATTATATATAAAAAAAAAATVEVAVAPSTVTPSAIVNDATNSSNITIISNPETNPARLDRAYNDKINDLFSSFAAITDNIGKTDDQLVMNKSRGSPRHTSISNVTDFRTTNMDIPMMEPDDKLLINSIITANILIFIIGFCGNSLVILVILRLTRVKTVTDIYILNLAFADLMFLFGLIFLIITMFIDHWIFGNLMCKLYMASTSLNQFASSLLLVVMSFDRFIAVCHPLYAQRFRFLGRARIICFCIWITCLILMTPIFAFAKTNKELTCAIFWPDYKSFNCEIAFTLYSFGIGFAVPLLLIAGFYACVIRQLRNAASGPISMGSRRRSRNRETTNKRVEHLVIGIICTYTICWLPYWITQLCVSFTTQFEHAPIDGFYQFVLIATCLSYTNSALNPILYAFLSDNFKRRCADVFRSIYSNKCCKSPHQDPHVTIATGLGEPSELNNINNHNNNANSIQRPESRHAITMNESGRLMTSSSRYVDTQKLTTATTATTTSTTTTIAPSGTNGEIVNDLQNVRDNYQNDDGNEHATIQSYNTNPSDNETNNAVLYSTESHLNWQQQCRNNVNNLNDHDDGDHINGSNLGTRLIMEQHKMYGLETLNDGGNGGNSLDNQAKRKSVAFSVGTIVVQGPDNNGPIVKSDHKILQVSDKKLQQHQEAV